MEPVREQPETVSATSSTETLAIERYAEVLAHIVYFRLPAEAEVLARLGIDRSTWVATDAQWTEALVGEALEEEHPVSTAFAAAFGPVLKRLKAGKLAIDSIGALPVPMASPPVHPPKIAIPEPPPVLTDVSFTAPTTPIVQPIFVPQGPVATTSGALDTPWVRWTGVRSQQRTMAVDATKLLQAALPFMNQGPATTLARPSTPHSAQRALRPPHATSVGDTGSAGVATTSAVATRELPSPDVPHRFELTTTSAVATRELPSPDVPHRFELPFVKAATTEGKAPAASSQVAPELTLEQYALFRARLSLDGEESPGAWKDFGVESVAAKEALQARFSMLFRKDPVVQARFIDLLRTMEADLREKRASVAARPGRPQKR